jgi:hypothetical protein
LDTRDCSECGRLWRVYAQATTKHIALVNEQKSAYQNREFDRAKELDADIAGVGQDRQAAGDAVHKHEAEAHGLFASQPGVTRGAGEQ